MMRVLLIIFASLVLTSCWIGRSLFAPSDARAAIPPAVYQATAPEMPKRIYRVSLLPNGLTQFDTGEKREVYGFAPLDRDSFVAWVQIEDARPDEDNQLYLLAVREPGGVFMMYAPECRGDEAEIARKSGAAIEAGTQPACRFPTRAGLEKAMRLIPRDPAAALRLERIR
ncbi:MAG: hypothetical protein ACJ8CC_04855 [Microvirga sp.]|jgi:hypothetical protein